VVCPDFNSNCMGLLESTYRDAKISMVLNGLMKVSI